jgi:hypothetical protein
MLSFVTYNYGHILTLNFVKFNKSVDTALANRDQN